MKSRKLELVLAFLALALSVVVARAAAGEKPTPGKIVDAGSFGIFLNGKRIGTEKFQIEQQGAASVTTSEVSVDDGTVKAAQSCELKLGAMGDVQRYAWRELSPGKGQAVVEPDKDLLIQRVSATASSKAEEQPYILPPSTPILDDYFFSHRELLTWRYIAEACKGQTQCKMDPAQFAVLVPRQRTSMSVAMAYAGREKIAVRGVQRELDRFNLQADGVDWALWLDESHKVVRMLIVANNIEVVRD